MYPAHAFELPICPVCTESVLLEHAVTDEFGRAIHEECYLSKLCATDPITTQRKPPHTARLLLSEE
jgi:hypothetical protein